MTRRLCVFVLVAWCFSFSVFGRSAAAQGSSLDADLKKQYKATRLGIGPTGLIVADQGVILEIRKGGIRSYPPATLVLATNKVQDGNVDTPKDNPFLGPSKLLPEGTKVYVVRVSTDSKKDRVIFIVMECDPCNGARQPSYFKAQISFQFPQGYLGGGADAGQISDVVSQVLAPENSGGDANGQQQQQEAPAPPATERRVQSQDQVPAPAPPPQQTQTISKGMTEDQVTAAFGNPDKIVDLGAKKLYIYKDMKVTFLNGKVSDVQ
jgi:hypothetical protein